MKTVKKRDSLIFKFTILLTIFIVVSMALIGFANYQIQTRIYRERSINDIKSIGAELETTLLDDSENLKNYLDWITVHYDELYVPVDFDNWEEAEREFNTAFAEQYPGKVFGTDVVFEDLPVNLKNLFATYYYEYTTTVFEQFRESFHIPYTYFIYPTGNGEDCMYIVDVERIEETGPDGRTRLHICDISSESHDDNTVMWEVWESGKKVDKVDYFNNEYGVTYSYYVPLYLNNEKVGIIGVDADIKAINRDIISGTTPTMIGTLITLAICTFLLLRFIDHAYISKLVTLQENVKSYTENKNVVIADKIEQEVTGKDEISLLSFQIADMIRELEQHIKKVVDVTKELTNQKIRTEMMKDLAQTDSLTFLNNRYSYSEKVNEINDNLKKQKDMNFSVIMIDLNFLKKLNDEHGHEKGDIALQRVADYIKEVFGIGNSYRIGGDEFSVILINDAHRTEALCKLFSEKLEKDTSETPWQHVSAAIGYSMYNKETDTSFEDVANRADDMMYENKKIMKAERVD